ncbi:hypothetical protein V5O48_003022 [Marasmius crinis-equi]|uniref:HNH nuclease domain-containing protein n=1 Tax=Marasmius crinis-equi TaxID=585013 RepID=A0ABR3FUC9_9AGAR
MTDAASLQDLALAVNASRVAPGRAFFDTYLGPPSNNPQKSTDPIGDAAVYTFMDKFNTPAVLAVFLLTNTLPSVTSQKSFSQIGEYFNLFLDNKTNAFQLTKLRNARMTLCTDFVPEGQRDAPKEVVSNSVKAQNTLRKLQDMTEERFNRWAFVPVVKHGLVRPSNTGQDVMVTVLYSPRLFDCGALSAAGPASTSDDDFDKPLAPPSSTKKADALKRARTKGIDSPEWLDSLPDSNGRYDATIRNLAATECIFVVTPEVYDYDGVIIPPTAYSASIGDRQWQFAPGDGRTNHDRIYHLEISRLHLLRASPDQRKRDLVVYFQNLSAVAAASTSATSGSLSKAVSASAVGRPSVANTVSASRTRSLASDPAGVPLDRLSGSVASAASTSVIRTDGSHMGVDSQSEGGVDVRSQHVGVTSEQVSGTADGSQERSATEDSLTDVSEGSTSGAGKENGPDASSNVKKRRRTNGQSDNEDAQSSKLITKKSRAKKTG